jgi:signal transduction histidine kinase/CheY-like chemotaxis protein
MPPPRPLGHGYQTVTGSVASDRRKVIVKNRGSVRAVLSHVVLPAALAVAAGLFFGVWVILAGSELAQTGRQASQQATLAAQGVAAGVDATLSRFTEQVQAVRPADFAITDRVELTARLLRLQTLLPASATFMLTGDGQLLAASAPFARADAMVGDTSWFRRAIAAPAGALVPQRLDTPWLGMSSGVVLTRAVGDAAGKPAGLIGAILPQASLEGLISPDWLAPQISLSLLGGAGGELLPQTPDRAGALDAQDSRTQRLMLSLLAWFGQPTGWTGTAPLHTIAAAVSATLPTSLALPRQELSAPIVVSGCTLLAAWLCCVLLVLATRRRPRGEAVPIGFGADWQCDLEAAGIVVAHYGNPPDAVRDSIGQPLLTALGPQRKTGAAGEIAAALQQRASRNDIEVRLDDRAWRISLAPEKGGGFICTGRDMTGEAAALASRNAAETALSDARRNQDRLLTSLGHDIRTPMTSIMGTCELLLDGELEQEQRVWLERVQGSCGALLGMLNGLLAVSEDETARGALVCEPVDVSTLVQEVVDILRPQARDKALELHARCDDLLRGQWLVDPSRLRQVVFNLASNAVKYTAVGRVEIRASAIETGDESRLRIAVSDTGPGIDPEERDEIFERFRRGRAHEAAVQGGAAQGGLGLGLALCRENARVMGGTITLESALGVGSEFTFECPASRVPVQNRLLPFAGRTALIVADDGPETRALAAQLGELGLMVETAPDGYLGLALAERLEAQRGAVDLVVLQGNLAGMPGEVFVIRLRNTAFGSRAAVIWIGNGADTAEVDAIVPAPPDPYQVATVVKQLLALRPSLDALVPHNSLARGGRILLVEDDKANQTLLAAALSRRGFAVFTAGNGEDALRLASHDSFDAVLMDLQMSGIDGFETVRRMRALHGHAASMPIIALTALQGATLRQRCEAAGFTSLMEKPVNLDRLTASLDRMIGGAVPTQAGTVDYAADVSATYLQEMVTVVGIDRARAGVAEFIADATARCLRLGELLPGWEVEAILRACEAISGRAETCGAYALGELLEEIADAVTRDDRETAATLVARLDAVVARLPAAMTACLDDLERRWPRGTKAA